jgi:hypothetical protein
MSAEDYVGPPGKEKKLYKTHFTMPALPYKKKKKPKTQPKRKK